LIRAASMRGDGVGVAAVSSTQPRFWRWGQETPPTGVSLFRVFNRPFRDGHHIGPRLSRTTLSPSRDWSRGGRVVMGNYLRNPREFDGWLRAIIGSMLGLAMADRDLARPTLSRIYQSQLLLLVREHVLLFCLLGPVVTALIILVIAPEALIWALALIE